jgi:hypothetical protein
MWIASWYLQPKWYLLACTYFDASPYYACHFVRILVWTEEKVLRLILHRWYLPFVMCSPNFIIHFHLRDDAHVNIPVHTPKFRNSPTSLPSRKSTATLRRNTFQKAHHRNSAHSEGIHVINFLSAGDPTEDYWLHIFCPSHEVCSVVVTVDPPRYLRNDTGGVV